MMPLHFEPGVDEDVYLAVRYYDEQLAGLGSTFLEAFDAALDRIRILPGASSCDESELRNCPLNQFPYALIYRIDPEYVSIIALIHTARGETFRAGRLQRPD